MNQDFPDVDISYEQVRAMRFFEEAIRYSGLNPETTPELMDLVYRLNFDLQMSGEDGIYASFLCFDNFERCDTPEFGFDK